MPHLSFEFVLSLGYAIFLAVIAFLLELVARHAHRRSLTVSTIGFTYHPERDIWRCPEDQHLFPIFSDPIKGTVVYRASAHACNSCRSKSACTDSDKGRVIERRSNGSLQSGMQRFHRGISLTLLVLANLILAIEMWRATSFYPRAVLIGVFAIFGFVAIRICSELLQDTSRSDLG
jgi:heme A synthase